MIHADSGTLDRDQWLAERRRIIGASEAPEVLGLRPSRLRLFLDKTGRLPPEPPSEEQAWGLRLEPLIADAYQERTGRRIIETQRFLRHPEWTWMGATIDGMRDDLGIVEFKAVGPHGPGAGLGDDGDSETLPDAWVVQGHHQMMVAGLASMDFAVFGPGLRLRVYPLRRSEPLCEAIREETREFWTNHVEAGIPPAEFDPRDAETLSRAFRGQSGAWLLLGDQETRAAHAYAGLGERIRQLQAERDRAKARLLLSLGDADGADLEGGWSVRRRVVTVNHPAREAATSEQVRLFVSEPPEK